MVRDNRVRLSDEEMERLRDEHEALWGEGAADDVPYGRTILEALEAIGNE